MDVHVRNITHCFINQSRYRYMYIQVHLLVHCTCSTSGVCTCSLEELIANGRERVMMDVHVHNSTLCFINQSRYRYMYICFYIHCTCSASGVL